MKTVQIPRVNGGSIFAITGKLWATSAQNKPKPKPASKPKPKPMVKANPPTNKGPNGLLGGRKQEVDYFAVTATGAQSMDHKLGLSETFIGPHPGTENKDICNPPCTAPPSNFHQGEFEDTWGVNPNAPFTVERRWTVDGQSAEVLDQKNTPFDYEILHLSNENNPVFQLEYKDDPTH